MPKRTKRVSKKKSRTSRRKFKRTIVRRKKIVRKKGSKRKWFKKWKGHKSIYKFANSQGLKFSRWMSLAEFLVFQYSDFVKFFLAGIAAPNDFIGFNYRLTPTGKSSAINWLSKYFTVFSTTLMKNTNQYNSHANYYSQFLWKAWNPIICTDTVGPYLSTMLHMYDKFKFSGVQVKWRPNVKFVTANVSPYHVADFSMLTTGVNGDAANLVSVPNVTVQPNLANIVPYCDYDQWKNSYFVNAPATDIEFPVKEKMAFNSTVPVIFRLWVNFQKNGYECGDDLIEKNILSDNTSGATESSFIKGSRPLFRRIFDDHGQFLASNSKIKCYNLNRPFKFYVTPMLQTRVYEPMTNENKAANYEEVGSAFQKKVDNSIPNNDIVPGKMIRAGWMDVGCMQPWNVYPEEIFHYAGAESNQVWLAAKIKERGYYDPVLFSYFLTCDNLAANEMVRPFGIHNSDFVAYNNVDYANNFSPIGNDYIEGLGRFKVTFYVKFKHRRRNIITTDFPYRELNENALLEVEAPQLMDTEPGDWV